MRGMRTILTSTLAAAAIALAGQSAAQAAPAAEPDRVVAVVEHNGTEGASVNAACAITRYGHTGYRVCGFAYFDRYWSSGNVETFVVGTNYAIYHIWSTSNGWRGLGGRARTQTPNGAYPSNVFLGVRTIGTDHRYWCRYWSSSGWTGWQRCV